MQILTRYNKVIAHSKYGYTPVGNSAVCCVTKECYDDAHIVTVDCVPTDIDQYDYYYVNGKFIKGNANHIIREVNNYKKLRFWMGTKEQYDAMAGEDLLGDCFCIITDDTTTDNLLSIVNGDTAVPKASMAEKDYDGNVIASTYGNFSRYSEGHKSGNYTLPSKGYYHIKAWVNDQTFVDFGIIEWNGISVERCIPSVTFSSVWYYTLTITASGGVFLSSLHNDTTTQLSVTIQVKKII